MKKLKDLSQFDFATLAEMWQSEIVEHTQIANGDFIECVG